MERERERNLGMGDDLTNITGVKTPHAESGGVIRVLKNTEWVLLGSFLVQR